MNSSAIDLQRKQLIDGFSYSIDVLVVTMHIFKYVLLILNNDRQHKEKERGLERKLVGLYLIVFMLIRYVRIVGEKEYRGMVSLFIILRSLYFTNNSLCERGS